MSQAPIGNVIKRHIDSSTYKSNEHTPENEGKFIMNACAELKSLNFNEVIYLIVNPSSKFHSLLVSKSQYFGPNIPKSIHAILAFFFTKHFPSKAITSSSGSFNFAELKEHLKFLGHSKIVEALNPSDFNHIFMNKEKNTLSFSKDFMDEPFELKLTQEEPCKLYFNPQTDLYDSLPSNEDLPGQDIRRPDDLRGTDLRGTDLRSKFSGPRGEIPDGFPVRLLNDANITDEQLVRIKNNENITGVGLDHLRIHLAEIKNNENITDVGLGHLRRYALGENVES